TDAKGIDRRTGGQQARDLVLVQTAAEDDLNVGTPLLVQNAPNGARPRTEIAAVDPHGLHADRRSRLRQLPDQRRDATRGALRVVGIDEQCRATATRGNEIPKCLFLAVVRLDE